MAFSDAELIYNLALGYIGAYNVTEGDTASKQAVICIRYYLDALKETIASHPWNFAKKDIILYEHTDRPIFGHDRKYAIPSDSLRILTVDNSIGSDVSRKQAGIPAWEPKGDYIHADAGATPPSWSSDKDYYDGQFFSSSSITYEVLVTHTSDTTGVNEAAQIAVDVAAGNIESKGGDYKIVYVEYLWEQVDIDKWPSKAKQALYTNLASKIVLDLYPDALKRREALIAEFERLVMPQARSIDAAEGKPRPIFTSEWLRARQTGTGDVFVV